MLADVISNNAHVPEMTHRKPLHWPQFVIIGVDIKRKSCCPFCSSVRCVKVPCYVLNMSAYEARNRDGGGAQARQARRRTRTLKRVFVLLRSEDELRVPRPAQLRALDACGRVKELEFASNHTCQHIKELLTNAFRQLAGVPFER